MRGGTGEEGPVTAIGERRDRKFAAFAEGRIARIRGGSSSGIGEDLIRSRQLPQRLKCRKILLPL